MATFIPEWPRVSGRNLHIKRVLNSLDDAYAVRRVIFTTGWVPDLFVHHAEQGWLAITACDIPFSSLDSDQLFDVASGKVFKDLLAQFGKLAGLDESINHRLPKLLIMWSCSTEETLRLAAQYPIRSDISIRLLSREQFLQIAQKQLSDFLVRLDEENQANEEKTQELLGHYFPETEIPAVCTVKQRDFHRDNSAKLTRFFLDLEQEWASKIDLLTLQEQNEVINDASVRLINGVAGSGKTLIALNRARLLAQLFPQQSILLLIHNTPIVADIKARLHHAYGNIPDNLEITTFSAWEIQQWKILFGSWPTTPKPGHVANLIRHYRAQSADLKVTDAQLENELDFINGSLVTNENQYQGINRSGQGFALRDRERTQVWALYEAVTKALNRIRMWSAIPRDICLAAHHVPLKKYRHILVDEAQFFAPSWFQVLKLVLETDSNLFLCADPKQGFLKSRLSWKSVGIDVAGKTKRLRKSYRTTRALLQAASHILTHVFQGDPDDFLEPDFNHMEPGTPPCLIYTDSPQDAVDRMINEIGALGREYAGTLPLSNLLVIYGEKVSKFMLLREIGKQIGTEKIWWMNQQEHKKLPPHGYEQDYLRIVSLETATGLEANVVFLIGMENLLSEGYRPDISDDELAQQREEQARKLYMAMTRAGQRLILVSSQRLPRVIESVFSQN